MSAMAMPPREPGRFWAGLLAVLVHLLLVVGLVIGVSWQKKEPEVPTPPNEVDIWRNLPNKPMARVEPKVEPPKVEPAKPVKVEPVKVEPKVEPKPEPVVKQDINLIEKKRQAEAKRREQEELEKNLQAKKAAEKKEADRKAAEKRLDDEKRLKAEQAKADKQKQELADKQAKAKAEAEAKVDKQKAEKALDDMERRAEAAENQRRERELAQATAAKNSQLGASRDKIYAKIKGNISQPINLPQNLKATFRITLLPTGELLEVKLVKSSGNAAYDQAVEFGIKRSAPLPLPEDRALFPQLREHIINFSPEG